jgi:integrase
MYKRNGIYYIGYSTPAGYKYESTRSTNKRRAEQIESLRRAQALEGRLGILRRDVPNFENFSQTVLAKVQHPNTAKRYGVSRKALLTHFARHKVNAITPVAVEMFRDARYRDGITKATVNRDLQFLRLVCREAIANKFMAEGPFARRQIVFHNEVQERRKPRILTFEEEARLLTACPLLLKTAVVLVLETGLRLQSEALRLRWDDIDFEGSTLYVRRSKTHRGIRDLFLTPRCMEMLRDWQKVVGNSGFVFPSNRNQSGSLTSLQHSWELATEKAGLDGLWFYNLRHTYATRSSESGTPDSSVAAALGHSTTSILSTYSRGSRAGRLNQMKSFAAYCENQRAAQARAAP